VSAIAGCYWFDERPAVTDDLRVPTSAAAHRVRGAWRSWVSHAVALAYGPDLPNHERNGPQPFHDPTLRATIILDGRIDNRSEITNALDLDPRSPACAIMLAAYRRWGIDAGARTIGDYVVVIYDEIDRRLVCLRDPMGQRPLFYGRGPQGIVIGSEMQQVVRHPAIAKDVNEGAIAEYLTYTPVTMAETLWRDVYRLPPAHALEIDGPDPRVRRFWDFDPEARVRHASEAEYDEELRALVATTTACRVRDDDQIGVLLSGGIDSSIVAGLAQARRDESRRSPVHAFSIAFPGLACDESPYVDAVVDKWKLPLTRANVTLPSRAQLDREVDRYLDLPIYPNSLATDPLRRTAEEIGVRVMLTGCGGDEFFAGDPHYPLDLVRDGRLIAGARALVRPFLSDRMRQVLKPMFGAKPMTYSWIRPEFAQRVALDDRKRVASLPAFPDDEQRELYAMVTSLLQVLGGEIDERAAQACGLEPAHPLFDRRVAEFGLALPVTERWRGRDQKVLLKRALGRFLPGAVAARNDKAEFSSTYVDSLELFGGEALFTNLRSSDAGWVNGAEIADMYRRMIDLYSRGDGAYIALMGPLFVVAGLEIWLQRIGAIDHVMHGASEESAHIGPRH
jgi:asparagine synthase (glutamine-hydrolysing)